MKKGKNILIRKLNVIIKIDFNILILYIFYRNSFFCIRYLKYYMK